MKASVHHVGYGQIEYEENFWTGKRELTVNGQKLTKQKKNEFILNREDGTSICRVKGSFLTGVTLYIDQDPIALTETCKWYEWVCSISIVVFILIWGNIPALCQIIPLVGGAIGGAIGGIALCLNLLLMRKVKSVWQKLLIWLGCFAGTVLVCFAIAMSILILFSL